MGDPQFFAPYRHVFSLLLLKQLVNSWYNICNMLAMIGGLILYGKRNSEAEGTKTD